MALGSLKAQPMVPTTSEPRLQSCLIAKYSLYLCSSRGPRQWPPPHPGPTAEHQTCEIQLKAPPGQKARPATSPIAQCSIASSLSNHKAQPEAPCNFRAQPAASSDYTAQPEASNNHKALPAAIPEHRVHPAVPFSQGAQLEAPPD